MKNSSLEREKSHNKSNWRSLLPQILTNCNILISITVLIKSKILVNRLKKKKKTHVHNEYIL